MLQSLVIPLVANLTDDNGDGAVDLCDVPDIVVTAFVEDDEPGHLYVLDGATGNLHLRIGVSLHALVTPALGDLDGDQRPDIVAVDDAGRLVAVDPGGGELWRSDEPWGLEQASFHALAIADLDADGSPEIVAGTHLFSAQGRLLRTLDEELGSGMGSAPVPVDLDGDDDMEVVYGRSAFHHDGTAVFKHEDMDAQGTPTVADLDGDGLPEILVAQAGGLSLLEHDGTVTLRNQTPVMAPPTFNGWQRPASVHDFDGAGVPGISMSVETHYLLLNTDLTVRWDAPVRDLTGGAAGTAFDFLGDGTAEAMYADEERLYVFDAQGKVLLDVARSSRTLIEYPVVADVDNDGSAEIVVVSSRDRDGQQTAPTLQVIGDADDRWIQARRIWNQHSYHVTNITEDGRIPAPQPPHWLGLNTFRTNAQIEGGGLCVPELI